MVGFKRARETVTDAASKVVEAAADTKRAIVAVAVLALAALAIAVIALVRTRKVVTA